MHWRIKCRIWWAFLVRRSFRTGKLASWLAGRVTSSFMHLTHQVGQVTFWLQFQAMFRVRFVADFLHLADVCEEQTGFFEILWISSKKMHQANELFAFVLPMGSVNRFPFIHHGHDIQSRLIIPQNHRGIKLQSVCAQSALKMNVQLPLGFKHKSFLWS